MSILETNKLKGIKNSLKTHQGLRKLLYSLIISRKK
jgi:hypothetical protein